MAWQLAVRRLQLDGGTAARSVSGIAVAVAGAIALQTLLSGVQAHSTFRTGADLARAQAMLELEGRPASEAVQRFARVPGVRVGLALTAYDDGRSQVLVGDCAALRALAGAGRCRDGDAFAAGARTPGWRGLQRIPVPTDPSGAMRDGIIATPAAAAAHGGLRDPMAQLFLRLAPGDDALERARNAAAAIDPTANVFALSSTRVGDQFAGLRRAILAGAAATIGLVGASLLVSLLEQVRERRRLLAVLAAFGARRATLGLSVLWQAAVPVALGLALAVAAGAALGAVLLRVGHAPAAVDWTAVAALAGTGAAVVLAVTGLSLPLLWRLMRAEGLRTE